MLCLFVFLWEFFLQIEEVVWDTVKHDYTHYTDENLSITRRILFKLFSLFNRFCDPEDLPLRLPSKAGAYLLHKLEIEPELAVQEGLTFDQFLSVITQTCSTDSIGKHVNSLYSKLVRNVILQDRVKYRVVKKNDNLSLTWKTFTGTPNLAKNMVVNHRYLIIYDDDISDLDYIGQDFEPQGAVLHKIPMVKAEIRCRKSPGLFFNKHSSSLVIMSGDAMTTIELSFNVFKDEYKMYKWTDAVHQAVEMIEHGSDPLTKIYQANDLRPSYFKYDKPIKNHLPHLMKMTGSAVNMRSNLNKDPDRRVSAPQLEDILLAKRQMIKRNESDSSGISSGTDDENTKIKSHHQYGVVIQLHGNSHTIVSRNE